MLRHRFGWKRLSVAGALAFEADGSDAHLVFQLRPGADNDVALIQFLSELNQLEQRPVVLIWDGLPSHRSGRMREWLTGQRCLTQRATAASSRSVARCAGRCQLQPKTWRRMYHTRAGW